jgi:hypothetical protein
MSFSSAASLFAQAPAAAHTGQVTEMDAVRMLEQNALLALIGAVILTVLLWIACVARECTQLNKPRANGSKSFLAVLMLAAGLSAFGSSCTAAQRARAAEYHAAQAAENRTCPMNQHHRNEMAPGLDNRYPYYGSSHWAGPTYCKYCGQRRTNK